jgi:hypothetical protein
MPEAMGEAIRLTDDVENATIDGVDITFEHDPGWEDVISIGDGTGETTISDTSIEIVEGGQAIQIPPYYGRGRAPVELETVTVTGSASGATGGRHAIRVDRAGTVRALVITGDDCSVESGRYESTHHPIVNRSDESSAKWVVARAYNEREAIKLTEDSGGFDVSESVLHNGIRDEGAADLDTWDNDYPGA